MVKSALGTLLKELRAERDWRQVDVARESGVSLSEVQSIEQGRRRRAELETVQKLIATFPADRARIEEAAWADRGLKRRDFLAGGAAALSVIGLGNRRREDWSAAGEADSDEEEGEGDDDQLLDDLARTVIDLRSHDVRIVRQVCGDIARRHHGAAASSDMAKVRLAKSLLLIGQSYQEEKIAQLPPGIAALRDAKRLAWELENWNFAAIALMMEASLLRKLASGSRAPDAAPDRALRLLDQVVELATSRIDSPILAAWASQERAKVVLMEHGMRADTAFARELEKAQAYLRSDPTPHDASLWPSFMAQHTQIVVRDTELRGLAISGAPLADLERLAREARSFPHGLSVTLDEITIEYALAKRRLRSPLPEDQLAGLWGVVRTWEKAKSYGFHAQIRGGQQILREPESRLPPKIWGRCPGTGSRTLLTLDEDDRKYVCATCSRPHLKV